MRYRPLAILVLLAQIVLAPFVTPALADTAPSSPAILITEIKLGDPAAATAEMPKEYVTLYNQGDQPVSLSGWSLEYAKPTFDKTFCGDSSWTSHSKSGSASATALTGTLQPGEVSQPIVRQLTDSTAGSLHLVDGGKNILDLVGWGSTAPCMSGSPAAIPANAKSLQRFVDCVSNYPVDTDNNAADFGVADQPSPGYLAGAPVNCPVSAPAVGGSPANPAASCQGVMISEILPNPASTDSGREFIELYNPTSGSIGLAGCGLQVGGNAKIYQLPDVSLASGQYHAFYDSDTGLVLPNAAGGTVYLLSADLDELNTASYQPDLDDDVAWAWFGGTDWQATYEPTPNAANISQPIKPCPVSQERNEDTGRCRQIETASVSSAGKTAKSSALTPCKVGQTRNPDTNRCRAIAQTASSLKSCPTGQERNVDTNRCRKIVAANALAKVQDVSSAVLNSRTSWYLAGIAGLVALGYGAWEWRHDLANLIARLRRKW